MNLIDKMCEYTSYYLFYRSFPNLYLTVTCPIYEIYLLRKLSTIKNQKEKKIIQSKKLPNLYLCMIESVYFL